MGFWENLGSLIEEVGTSIKDAYQEAKEERTKAQEAQRRRDNLAKLFSLQQIVDSLDEKREDYLDAVRNEIRQDLQNSSTPALLEMNVFSVLKIGSLKIGETFLFSRRPARSSNITEWGGLFYHYLRNSVPEGREYRAGIENVIENSIKDASKAHFSSQEICDLLGKGLLDQIDSNQAIKDAISTELKGTGKFVVHEAKDLIKIHGHAVAADQFHTALVHMGHTVTGTAIGQLVLSALAMPVVKVAILKAVAGAVAMEGVRSVIVKIGITTLGTCLLGSAGASSLLLFAAIPVMAGILAYQWTHLPGTLAKEIPGKIVAEFRNQVPKIHQDVAKSFIDAAVDTLWDKIHEIAMEES